MLPDESPAHPVGRHSHLMRGVIIFGVAVGRACWARFYLEPVQGRGDVNAAIRTQVSGTG